MPLAARPPQVEAALIFLFCASSENPHVVRQNLVLVPPQKKKQMQELVCRHDPPPPDGAHKGKKTLRPN